MKLKDVRETYYTFSAKLSDSIRQLSFAGIAVVWIFRVGSQSGGIKYSSELLFPLGCFVASLALDLLQYLYATLAWSIFHRKKERSGIANDTEFKAPAWINWPTNLFFYSKTMLTIGGYTFLLVVISNQLLGE